MDSYCRPQITCKNIQYVPAMLKSGNNDIFLFMETVFRKVARRIKSIFAPRERRRYEYLKKFAKSLKARRIMEVGTNTGRSALEMIKAAQLSAPHPEDVSYFGFDLFEMMNETIHKKEVSKFTEPMAEVQRRLGATGAKISLFRGFSKDTLPEAVKALPAMDLIFIDGGHTAETTALDWEHCRKLMHEKTVVIFDDYWPLGFNGDMTLGCNKVLETIDSGLYDVSILPVHDLCKHDWGILRINFVKVTKKPSSSRR